jgi:hypothetical protein
MRYEAFNYVECTIPAGMTIREYRRAEAPSRRRLRHRMPRLLKRMT